MARPNRHMSRVEYYTEHGDRITTLTVERAEEHLLRGDATMRCRHCKSDETAMRTGKKCRAGREGHELVMVRNYGSLRSSQASIKHSEMQANAGAHASESFIKRARTKLEEWPYAGDTKAVRVGPVAVASC